MFVWFIESNYGGPVRAAGMMTELTRWAKSRGVPSMAMEEDIYGHNRPGIWVTHDYKERFVQYANQMLEDNRLAFHDHVVSVSLPDPTAVLVEQLRGFKRQFYKEPANGTGDDRKIPYRYCGKGTGKKDDVMMTALENWYFANRFLSDPRYMARCGKLPYSSARGMLKIKPIAGGDIQDKWNSMQWVNLTEEEKHAPLRNSVAERRRVQPAI